MKKLESQETPPSLGALLKARRIFLGKSLEEIERYLRIRKAFLEALEEDRLEDLPSHSYAVGFIRGYAVELGLDPHECLLLFQNAASPEPLPLPPLSLTLPNLRRNRVSWPFILLSAVCIGSALLFFLKQDPSNFSSAEILPEIRPHFSQQNSSPIPLTPALSHSEMYHPSSSFTPQPPLSPPPEIVIASDSPPLTTSLPSPVHVVAPTWIEVKNQEGRVIEQKLLSPGTAFPALPEGGTLTLGNGAGIEIEGEPLGQPGKVIRMDLPLERLTPSLP